MKKTALILMLAVTLLTTVAWGQNRQQRPAGPPPPPPSPVMALLPPPAGAIDRIVQALQLTTDQATALKTILTSSEADIKPKMQALGEKTKALRETVLVSAAQYDQAAVEAALADAQAAETAVITASIYWWNQISTSGILTDDQLAKLMAGPGPGGQQQVGPGGHQQGGTGPGSRPTNGPGGANRRR